MISMCRMWFLLSGLFAANLTLADNVVIGKVAKLDSPSSPYNQNRPQSDVDLSALSAAVYDQQSGNMLLTKNPDLQTPIASITKLMTAVVTLDMHPDLKERITITKQDIDRLKGTHSRLAVGATHTREQLLNLALIASENRAAHALGRTYPGGEDAFVAAMNRKAHELGMSHTFYVDPTGLSSFNQSTAQDLVKLVNYAYTNYPEIRDITTSGEYSLGKQRVVVKSRKTRHRQASRKVYYRNVGFVNTNRLTRDDEWQIGLSKTGFINEAGYCLVMQAEIAQRPVIIVLLDAQGKYSRLGDANRIKRWLEEESSEGLQFDPPTSRGT